MFSHCLRPGYILTLTTWAVTIKEDVIRSVVRIIVSSGQPSHLIYLSRQEKGVSCGDMEYRISSRWEFYKRKKVSFVFHTFIHTTLTSIFLFLGGFFWLKPRCNKNFSNNLFCFLNRIFFQSLRFSFFLIVLLDKKKKGHCYVYEINEEDTNNTRIYIYTCVIMFVWYISSI